MEHFLDFKSYFMPSFENLIVGAPVGFNQSCSDVNTLALSDPDLLSSLVAKSLSLANFIPTNPAEFDYGKIIKAINFIIRSYKTANPAPTFPQMASALDLNSLLTRDSVEKIIVAIQDAKTNNSNITTLPLLSQVYIYI